MFSDKSVQADKKLVPYDIVSDQNKPMVQVTQNGKQAKFAPEEVSAMILSKMKNTAETFLALPNDNSKFEFHAQVQEISPKLHFEAKLQSCSSQATGHKHKLSN